MKKSTFIFLFAFAFGLTSYAQDYAKNSFGINTSGPFQGFGLQWNHQITEKTTFTAYYGQAVAQEWTSDNAYYPNDDQTGQGYSGSTFQNSSWTSFILNYRPLDNFQAFRVASGLGVGRLGGTLQGLTDNNTYFINGAGPFAYMGIGYGLKPVEGFQWGIDIGWIRGPGFTTQTDGVDAAAAAASLELTARNHELPFFPNAQITVAWGF
jgi:hypothetical protein